MRSRKEMAQTFPITFLILLNVVFWSYPANGRILHYIHYNTALNNASLKTCQHTYRNLTAQELARFVDASGKPSSGIYGGNTLWYGSYSECQQLPDSRYCLTMFPGSMSLVRNINQTYNMEWGVCMPDVCTNEDVRKNFEFLFKNVSGIDRVTPFTKFLQVKCAEDPEYTATVVITIIFCGLLVGICLLATIMEILKASNNLDNKAQAVENSGHISMDKDANEKTLLLPDATTKVTKDEGLFREILHSFSMIRNIKAIMNTNVTKSDLTYLHGIRVLSLFWIILVHVNVHTYQGLWPVDNLEDVIRSNRKLASMVLNAVYAVDTFFVLSGLLVMYTNMGKKMRNNGHTNWFKYYIHRYWRLTPTYAFCLLLVVKLRPFFGAGPLWFLEADTSACSENWWANLLYLNNFLKTNIAAGVCMGHTWYLAADMQMFLISPIFLLVAYRYRLRALLSVAIVAILTSVIVIACLAANDDALPMNVAFVRLNMFFRNDRIFGRILEEFLDSHNLYEPFKDIYIKPYCRFPPYVVGMVLGYVLYKHFSKEFKLPWKFVAVMWISAIALALTDVYAPYSSIKEDPRVWTTGESALFWSLKWSIWGLCIAWLIFASHYKYAGLVKDILAAKFWIPLSRINYAAYIIHFDVILVLIYNIETPIHYTSFTTVNYFLSSLVLTYAVAFIIAVVVELPCANLEALAWRIWEKK